MDDVKEDMEVDEIKSVKGIVYLCVKKNNQLVSVFTNDKETHRRVEYPEEN